jgi:DNA repair photolyase
MSAIYKPQGRAAEYAPLAVNLYNGCGHGCTYCWAPKVLRMEPAKFFASPQPKADLLKQLKLDAKRLRDSPKPVLLCFTCDPYQPCEEQHRLTRSALEVLLEYGLTVSILSKGGLRATRDLDLLAASGQPHAFGASLTALSPELSAQWEPLAAPPAERLASLRQAFELGLSTWASLEPVLDPEQTLALIEASHSFVRHFKLGKLNYHPKAKEIDWRSYRRRVKGLLLDLGYWPNERPGDFTPGSYFIKHDLGRWVWSGMS